MEKVLEIIDKYKREIIVSLFTILSLCALFLEFGGYNYNGYTEYSVNGYQIIFGYKDGNYTIYNPSVFGIISFIVVLICLGVPYLGLIKKNIYYYETLVLIVGIVMLVLLPSNANHASTTVAKYYVVSYTAYIAAGLLTISFIFSICFTCIDFIKEYKAKKSKEIEVVEFSKPNKAK